jgi:phosphoribosylaminoimidazole-succinocarboxamide synthase
MKKGEKLYAGKAKVIYGTDDPKEVIMEYTDNATAFNGLKKDNIANKGEINAKIATFFFELLSKAGIPSHFIKSEGTEMLVKKLEMIPIEVVVRNRAAGSLVKRLGLEEGMELSPAVVEFYYKDDTLGDPMVNTYHIEAMKLATAEQVKTMSAIALQINSVLRGFLRRKGIELVDFKLEFGLFEGEVLLGDEISPDTCRFWDMDTKEKLDKDRFRHGLGDLMEGYEILWKRIQNGE